LDLTYLSDLFSVIRRGPNTEHPNMGNVLLFASTRAVRATIEISRIYRRGFTGLSTTAFS